MPARRRRCDICRGLSPEGEVKQKWFGTVRLQACHHCARMESEKKALEAWNESCKTYRPHVRAED